MTAPLEPFTDAQAEHLARIEAAPACAESWEARVEAARAMHEVPGQPGVYGRIPWDRLLESHRDAYRAMVRAAAAALASAAPETDGLRERVEALAEDYEQRAASIKDGFWKRHLAQAGAALRVALASHTPGGEK